MEKQITENLRKEALKNGAIWGLINTVIFLVTWYLMPNLMTSYLYAGLLMLVGVALGVFFTLDMRKKAGGYWSFSQALGNILVMFLLSALITFAFNIIFGKYVDPSYPTTMKEAVLVKTESTFKSLGMSDADMSEAMEKTGENLDKQFSPTLMQAISGFGITAIFYFIGALIFAAIFKKAFPNPFVNQSDEEFSSKVD